MTERIFEHTLRVLNFKKIKELMAGYAGSPLGRKASLDLMPSSDRAWIANALLETKEMMDFTKESDRIPLSGLRDIEPYFEAVHQQNIPFEPKAFLDIASTLKTAGVLKRRLTEVDPEVFPKLSKFGENIDYLDTLGERLASSFDNKGNVVDTASHKLSQLRSTIRELQDKIRKKLERLVSSPKMRSFLQHTNISMRGNRYVLAVRSGGHIQIPGIVHDHSQTGLTEYIEPSCVVSLGADLDRIIIEERREVTRILWELTQDVLNQESKIKKNLVILSIIDLTYAKARYALAYNMNVPGLSEDGILKLKQIYHPYLLWLSLYGEDKERRPKEIIPINVRLGEDFTTLVVTGPNTGGKTVTLSTIGLSSIMVQSGIPVPAAQGSIFPVYKNIFVDIGDEQSIEQSLSTFSSHLERITEIIKSADKDSLVLIDELGAGTDPSEGAALGEAVIRYLTEKSIPTVVTTHLGRLKAYAYTHTKAKNACTEFDPITLSPKYKLIIGQPGLSNALLIAERLGFPKNLLENAHKLLEKECGYIDDMIQKLEEASVSVEQERERIDKLAQEAADYRDKEASKLAEVKRREENLSAEAEQEIEKVNRKFASALEELINDLKNSPKPVNERLASFKDEVYKIIEATPLAQKRLDYISQLKAGDQVYIPKFREKFAVKKVNKKRQIVTLIKGNTEIEVDFEDIRLPEA